MAPADLVRGISIVVGVKETIAYLKPPAWFIENPRGRLADHHDGCGLSTDA